MEKAISISSRLYDYKVHFITDFVDKLQEFQDNTTYVIDKNVYQLYKGKLSDIDRTKVYYMEPFENKKNMETVLDIIGFWHKLGVRKNWKVICIGGGITQDVTTIASNLFLRNVDWYFFPTTLLAMCDSCIGGKCGINFGEFKNQIGVFYPPKEIYIDIAFLNTLSAADYINGWGEILKFSLTDGKKFYERIKQEDNYIPCRKIEHFICEGLEVKKKIIEADEFEADLRRVLNYGHTFGHALEAYTHNEIPHGKGVIWGIDVVNYIAVQEKLISKEYYREIKDLIRRAFLPEKIEISKPETLFEIIKTDKKVRNNIVNLAVLDGESHLIIHPMKIDERLKGLFLNYIEETNDYYSN